MSESGTCPSCPHAAHFPGPCASCAQANTTCIQAINIVGGDGDRGAAGEIEMASGMEPRPCLMCRFFEKDAQKLRDHALAKKLVPDEQGRFATPIAKDFVGRKSLLIDPKNFGFCHKDDIVTDMLATCPEWSQVRTSSEFEGRIKS